MSLTATEEEDDDHELRDLVSDVLAQNGVLAKIKAQLRASVYLALDDGAKKSKDTVTSELQASLRTTEGRLLANLVREYLSFFSLDFTLNVFDAESSLETPRDRAQLMEGLGFAEEVMSNRRLPIMAEVLRLSKVSVLKSETPTPTERTEDDASMPSSLAESMDPNRSLYPAAATAAAINSDPGTAPELGGSNTSTPFSSLNVPGGGGLGGKRNSTSDSNSDVTKEVDDKETPLGAKPQISSLSSLDNLPPLSSAASNLPPLSSAGGRKTLAPLKKTPPDKKADQKLITHGKSQAPGKTLTSTSHFSSVKSSNDLDDAEEISEELDEFLNSSDGISKASEEYTKDETASEGRSLRTDYAEDV